MSDYLKFLIANPRNNTQSRGMAFITDSDKRGTTAYADQQRREYHAHGGAVGHHLHPMNPLQCTALKQGGSISKKPAPKRDYQAELNKKIAYKKYLEKQREDKNTELAHFTPQEERERERSKINKYDQKYQHHGKGEEITETQTYSTNKQEKRGKKISKSDVKNYKKAIEVKELALEEQRALDARRRLEARKNLEALAPQRRLDEQKRLKARKKQLEQLERLKRIQREGVTHGYTKDELEKIKKYLYVGNDPLTDTCGIDNIMARESINGKDKSFEQFGSYFGEKIKEKLKQFPEEDYGTQAIVEAFVDDMNERGTSLEKNDPIFAEKAKQYREFHSRKDTEPLFSTKRGSNMSLVLDANYIPYETEVIKNSAKDITDSLKTRKDDNGRPLSFIDVDNLNINQPSISGDSRPHSIFALRGHDYTNVLPENNPEDLDQSFTMYEPSQGLKRFYSKKDNPNILYDQEKRPYTDLSFRRNEDPKKVKPARIYRTLVDN